MKLKQARMYLEGVVLGLVRADLEQPSTRKDARKLSPHLYEALKRALYKDVAFFKGIEFPLLDGGCTLKEAAIIVSVLTKVRVPLLHSSAALIRLAGMDYSGPTSLSSACCWTRSTRCRTRCSTRSCSTLSGSRTRTRMARSPCCGTRACSCSAGATPRTSRRSRRTRCARSCARTRTRRSRTRSAVSSRLRPRAVSRRRNRTRWMFCSDVYPGYDIGEAKKLTSCDERNMIAVMEAEMKMEGRRKLPFPGRPELPAISLK